MGFHQDCGNVQGLARWVWNCLLKRTEQGINFCNFLHLHCSWKSWHVCAPSSTMPSSHQAIKPVKRLFPSPSSRRIRQWLTFRLSIDPTWRTCNFTATECKINIIILIFVTITWWYSMNDTDSTTSLSGSSNKSSLTTSEKQVKKYKISNGALTSLTLWTNWLTKIMLITLRLTHHVLSVYLSQVCPFSRHFVWLNDRSTDWLIDHSISQSMVYF